MQAGIRRISGVAAAVAIALHTVLSAVVAPFAAPSVDPFAVICHSGESAPIDQQAPSGGVPSPAHACDHCNLCSALTPPVPEAVLAAFLVPARVLQVLHPVGIPHSDDASATPKLARGPPHRA
jgi:hypothetical protein